MEDALRSLDRSAEREKSEGERMEKALAEYNEQLHRPFEHEERLRELCAKQQEINRQLDKVALTTLFLFGANRIKNMIQQGDYFIVAMRTQSG